MATGNIHTSDPQLLAKLMSLDTAPARTWQSDELSAVLRHQFQSPLEFDLITVDTELKAKLKTLTPADGPPLKTFEDLLRHSHPPIELLTLTKEYGKVHRNSPDSPLPHDIATVLYFAGIVVALTKCGQRITQLTDDDLRRGVEWVVAQPWVDEVTRSLFREGLALIPARE